MEKIILGILLILVAMSPFFAYAVAVNGILKVVLCLAVISVDLAILIAGAWIVVVGIVGKGVSA